MNFTNLLDETRKHARSRVSAKQISGEERDVSFVEFLDEVDALAGRLSASGIGQGMQIGFQAPNCYEYLVWDLAAMKLGAVIHAIPDDLPVEKINALSLNQRMALWVCDKPEHLASLPDSILLAGSLSDQPMPIDWTADVLPDRDLYSRAYSSGSAGYLKGLNISRKGTELFVSDFIAAFELRSTDSHLIFLPLSIYQQRLSVYACLWAGTSIKVVRHTAIFQELGRYKPSFIIAPPVIYENIYNLFGRGTGAKEKLSTFLGGNIRFMITGMAPIRTEILHTFNEHGFQLREAYGTTETGIIAWNTEKVMQAGSVGIPLHPDQVHLSDESEVIVRKPFPLSKGYFDYNEAENSDTFLPDGGIATGDIGVINADGFLTLKGRKKELIVTGGGAKLHPEELEQALLSMPIVKHAIVLVSARTRRLIAALVVEQAADPDTIRLIDDGISELNGSVPAYKNINRKIITSTIPSVDNGMLTKNLKYDRKAIYRFFQAEIEAQEVLSP